MNGAPEDKKIDLMANIIIRMVEQRSAMTTRMEQMHMRMMQHIDAAHGEGQGIHVEVSGDEGMKGMGDKSENASERQQEEPK